MSSVENSKENIASGATPKGAQPSTWKRNGHSQTLMRNAAVALAEWGAYVLPTHGVVKSKEGGYECSCDAYSRKQAAKRKREWKPCTNIGKVPFGLKWQDDATTDPEIAYNIWSERKHHFSNIGILCGAKSGLVGLDIDGEVGLASLKALEEKFGTLPHTVTVKTGSGGRHFWFRLPPGVEISNSAKALGAAALGIESTNVDVRGTNGQLIAPPSMHKSGNQYEFLEGCGVDDIQFDEVPYLPEWLVKLCEDAKASNRHATNSGAKAKKESKSNKTGPEGQRDKFADAGDAMPGEFTEGVEHFLSMIGDHDGGAGFENPIYQAACSYFSRNGVDAPSEAIHKLLRDRIAVAVRDPNKERGGYDDDDYLSGRIEQACDFIDANPPTRAIAGPTIFDDKAEGFRVLNQKTAIVHLKGKTRFLKEDADGAADFQNQADANLTFAPYQLRIKENEHTKYLPLLPLWTKDRVRREYAGVTFDPSETSAQDGSSPDHIYNLWKGFALTPAMEGVGSWRLMQRHLFNVICNGDVDQFVWVCGWFADILQKPGHKTGTSIVAIGGYGTGKSIIGTAWERILGKNYTYIDDEEGLAGKFNAHFEVALLADVAEAYFSGNLKIVGKIKSLITAEKAQLERKGIDKVQVDNFTRFYQTANPNKENKIIFAEPGERRYYVTNVGGQHAKDPEYFVPLVAEIEGDGPATMMRDLLAVDISDIDLRNPPLTEAFGEQVAVNMSQPEKWWMAVLETGSFPQKEYENQDQPTFAELEKWETEALIVDKKIVCASYNSRVRPYGGGETDERSIAKALYAMVPGLVDCRPTRPKGMPRPRCFSFPPLAKLREEFTRKTNIRLGEDMKPKEAVTADDLRDPFFAAGYVMVADATIDMVFAREWIEREADDGYIEALDRWRVSPENEGHYESRVHRAWYGVARPRTAD